MDRFTTGRNEYLGRILTLRHGLACRTVTGMDSETPPRAFFGDPYNLDRELTESEALDAIGLDADEPTPVGALVQTVDVYGPDPAQPRLYSIDLEWDR